MDAKRTRILLVATITMVLVGTVLVGILVTQLNDIKRHARESACAATYGSYTDDYTTCLNR